MILNARELKPWRVVPLPVKPVRYRVINRVLLSEDDNYQRDEEIVGKTGGVSADF